MDFIFPENDRFSCGNTGAFGATKTLTVKDYQDALSDPNSTLSIIDYNLLREASKHLSYREFISNTWVQKYVDIPRVARHNNLFWETVEILGWSRLKVIPLVMKEEINLYLQNKILNQDEIILVIKHHRSLCLKMLRQLQVVDLTLLYRSLPKPLSEEETKECLRLGMVDLRPVPFRCDRAHFALTGTLFSEDVEEQVITFYNEAIESLKINGYNNENEIENILNFLLSQTTKIPRPSWWVKGQRHLEIEMVNKIEKLFV